MKKKELKKKVKELEINNIILGFQNISLHSQLSLMRSQYAIPKYKLGGVSAKVIVGDINPEKIQDKDGNIAEVPDTETKRFTDYKSFLEHMKNETDKL